MAEKFKILKRLGSGGFAATYLVEVLDRKLKKDWGEKVVIKKPHDKEKEKILVNELVMNASLHANLLNFQQSASSNIVRYLGYESFEDLYVMVMEYVEGESLRSILGGIGSQNPVELHRALDIVLQVCEGLSEMHKFHIFHRDIKPENILLCKKDGSVKILDLGISRVLNSEELASTLVGTPLYTPKEIILGKGGAFYSDIYSLGVTMYEMITGELPFMGSTFYEIQERILNSTPKQPKEINPELDDKINRIILKSIEKDPDKRYKTAESLINAIDSYRKGKDEDDDEIDRFVFETQGQFISGNYKSSEAERKLKELIEKYPHSPKSHVGLGEFYNRCQRYQDAVKAFNKAIELNPNFALAYRNIALSLYAIGQQKEAIASLKKALNLGLEQSIEKHARKLMELWDRGRKPSS